MDMNMLPENPMPNARKPKGSATAANWLIKNIRIYTHHFLFPMLFEL
jgi:hypothetical protein